MTSKAAHHFQLTDMPWVNDLPAAYAKGVNPPVDNPWPGKIVIGRWFMEDGEANALVQQRERGAEEWYRRQLPEWRRRPYVAYWELPNEPVVDTIEQCDNLAAFSKRAAYLAHTDGQKVVGGNLAQGTPGGMREHFLRIVPGLQACDLWSQHCYYVDSPQYAWHRENGFNQWHALRIIMNKGFADSAGEGLPPAIVGEGVVDGGVVGVNDAGYRTIYGSEERYMQEIARYDQAVAPYDWLLAFFIFTAGPIGWLSFETTSRLHALMKAHIVASGGPYVPAAVSPPPPPPPPEPQPVEITTMVTYSQRDARWSRQRLGGDTQTIGQIGCLLTAAATLATRWGRAIDPGTLNRELTANGGYAAGADGVRNLLVWSALRRYGIGLLKLIDCAAIPAPVDEINVALQDGRAVFILLDSDPGGKLQQHWVLLDAVMDKSGHISDPWQMPGEGLTALSRYFAAGWDSARAIYGAAICERVATPEALVASGTPAGPHQAQVYRRTRRG